MVDNLLSVDEGSAGQNFRVTTDSSGPLEMRTVPNLQTPDGVAAIYAANWAVTDWYLDGNVGLDTNNGTAPGTPLRTGAELCRRLGPYALWGQSVTVHVLSNGMLDPCLLRGCMLVAGTHLDVIGTPTRLASDVIGSYAAVNHATPVATQITGTSIIDWTSYQFCRIRVTSGTRNGAICWVAMANPAGVGVATARISVPAMIDPVSNSAFVANVALTFGDPFDVQTLPNVPAISILIDGPILYSGTSQYKRRLWSLVDIQSPSVTVVSPAENETRKAVCFGCALGTISTAASTQPSTGTFGVYASMFYATDLSFGGFVNVTVNAYNCLFGSQIVLVSFNLPGIIQRCLFQGVRVVAGTYLSGTDVQIFDVPGASNIAFQSQRANMSNLSGSGNAGFGISATNESFLAFLGTTNLQGTVSNAKLNSAPVVNLTLPQFLQPSDYAQKGTTPAMVAGATTVTVPWYDNVNQKVTATHATVGGTQGILRVTQSSTSQFTITSSNAADTSTVNWQISPLGRNIFISTT